MDKVIYRWVIGVKQAARRQHAKSHPTKKIADCKGEAAGKRIQHDAWAMGRITADYKSVT